jgi:hypothetical protein
MGWGFGWGNHSLFVNNGFIHRNNFNAGRGGSLSGRSNWSHDASHRGGVPYANAAVSSRYGGNVRQNLQSRGANGGTAQSRSATSQAGSQRMGNRQIAPSESKSKGNAFGGVREGGAVRSQSDHGYGSLGPARTGGGGGFGGGGGGHGGGGGGGGGHGGGGGGGHR